MTNLLDFLKVNQRSAKLNVFKYLAYDTGSHELRNVPHKALIACTSRTGSSLLQVALERYGLDAGEHLNPEGPPKRAFETGKAATIVEYASLLAQTAAPAGRFVVKGALYSLLYLYFLGEMPEFVSDWKFIFLRRRNVVRQAISMHIAQITNQWTAAMPAKRSVLPADYRFDELNRLLDSIFAQNDKWERAFGYLGIEPLRIFYEDAMSDLPHYTEMIAEFMGIDTHSFPQAREHTPWLKQQSTDLNYEWEARFREDLTARITKRPCIADI